MELCPGGRAHVGEHAKETGQEVPQLLWKECWEEALPSAGLSRPRHLPAVQPRTRVCIVLAHKTLYRLLALYLRFLQSGTNSIMAHYWDKGCCCRLIQQILLSEYWSKG